MTSFLTTRLLKHVLMGSNKMISIWKIQQLFIALNILTSTHSFRKHSRITKEKRPLECELGAFTFPDESEEHEGTWLQWPHEFEYGIEYRENLDDIWVQMTKALCVNEKVHIIAYNKEQVKRIKELLQNETVPLTNVDFKIYKTNDVWVRDNGPIFAKDSLGRLVIQDWKFNGWGGKTTYKKDDAIPTLIGKDINMKVVSVGMANEGGAVELDGNGALLATRSSIISQKPVNSVRNPGMTQSQAEIYFSHYYGASKFIWLDGGFPKGDITDMHIDGIARFAPKNKLVTMSRKDLIEWGLSKKDINTLYLASNVDNKVYDKVYLPLSKYNVNTTDGESLGYKGSYINYYIANGVVLVPNYDDPNDDNANKIIQKLYPERKVIGIDIRNLYKNGGMIHCVTQQQPAHSL
ncbi:putative agmatine deiminase isoform X2 [Hydra vulgaris]|uniref:putative agmatine deiminase isoform X2 n=1 Tax=Hydra vulgaris TaxID=6087 RepID=UPI001F5F1078|nr:putative agmatine deiminase isoform X2 [Hydra vulgaris]